MNQPDPSTVRYPGQWIHRDIHANGIRFHVVEVGEHAPDAPLVVLLHGFADFWYSWRHQLAALARSGVRAIAVDLRGYGDSDKPPRGYDGWTLAGDIVGLVRALGYPHATFVGHADGGLVCWASAALHPRLVSSMVLINAPHPISLRRAVLKDSAQRAALLPHFVRYQVPLRPERLLTRRGGAAVGELMSSRAGSAWKNTEDYADTAAKMSSAIRIPGAAHCALEYQRWAFRSQFRAEGRRFMAAVDVRTSIPVAQISGDLDPYVLPTTLDRDRHWAPGLTHRTVRDVGHYVHQEAPDVVSEEILRVVREI
ncbi:MULTISPECIES: alpha/beta hydrolase [unclassified Rhodococcus (in: high G+C Gram-positive bacteria)]|uniref:alpha/beta fold hydrolase n=1 Tax=unclassified Rhodococcus (in: high G+C Gram-positive bacteria) TaxID=192944 RepID=UPI0011EBEF4C|nr:MULTISPECIES: alpha/beta hydrolase [unclassified Rhodococcus (in: high G+C Gram-positive bacteria)]KAA0924051.1 alpha/beta hydrolase [Rhodococcus sp. ANT_H53B]MDI9926644.1 alpha/beta hydrolase [Rhodococcus sp. IEGM 1341]